MQPESWYSFTVPRTVEGWVDLVDWLHIEIWFTRPQTVTHPGTNQVWRSATTLIEANALPLSQTANQNAVFQLSYRLEKLGHLRGSRIMVLPGLKIYLWPRMILNFDLVSSWTLTSYDLELWPRDPQSQSFHVFAPQTTCENWHQKIGSFVW